MNVNLLLVVIVVVVDIVVIVVVVDIVVIVVVVDIIVYIHLVVIVTSVRTILRFRIQGTLVLSLYIIIIIDRSHHRRNDQKVLSTEKI